MSEYVVPAWSKVAAYFLTVPIRLFQTFIGVLFGLFIAMEKGDIREAWYLVRNIWTEPLDVGGEDDGGIF